jgi:putative alpha-1,2-mannosidase
VLYLFAVAGRSDRTQFWVRKVLNELYSSTSFAGDEDTGSMAAWFVLSSCGFYPFCAGKPEYVLGSPLFDAVTLTSERGHVVKISAKNNSAENFYVHGVKINGVEHREVSISHKVLMAGAKLDFSMGASPKNKNS